MVQRKGASGPCERPAIAGVGPVNDITASETAFERERDRHLFSRGPKRMLALDGGGVRGAITVAFLEQIEKVLCDRLGLKEIHLGDWFDLVGGTSTGSIIAGALALGYSVKDIKTFYTELAPKVFRRQYLRIPGLRAKFDAKALRGEIAKIVEDRTLDTQDLITGLCIVTKRMDTGSPWILSNNPRAPYWERGANKDYKLANLVRASTAAPFFFDPEMIAITEKVKGLFVDGGVTPHNNPSLVLFLMTIYKSFDICWDMGPDKLSIVSIGTGTHRDRMIPDELGLVRTTKLAIRALTSLMSDAQLFVLQQMQFLGQCPQPWLINSEIGTLAGDSPPHGKLFRFLRYDVRLELPWIRDELGLERVEEAIGKKLTEAAVVRMRSMDDPLIIPDIYNIAKIAADIQVKPEHWLGDMPTWCDGTHAGKRPRLSSPAAPPPNSGGAWSAALNKLRHWRNGGPPAA